MLGDSIFSWYSQFTMKPTDVWDHNVPNIFQKVPQSEISSFEKRNGVLLPGDYVRFLTDVGFGRLTRDKYGNETFDYLNFFMPLSQISRILEKKTGGWDIFPEFIYESEMPFIDLGSHAVHVFEPDGSICFPGGKTKVACNFLQYLEFLMSDIEFYVRTMRH